VAQPAAPHRAELLLCIYRECQKPGMAALPLCVENNVQMQNSRKFEGFRAGAAEKCRVLAFGVPGLAETPPALYNRGLRSDWLAPRRSSFSHLRGFHQRNTDRGKGLLKPTFEK
jgi:hypothetical protein